MSIPDSLHAPLINLLSSNLSKEEIDLLGKYMEPKFNAHILSGEPFGITLRPEQAAQVIVKHFSRQGRLGELIVLLIGLESNPSTVRRAVSLAGLDEFTRRMGALGYVYDRSTDSIVQKAAGEEDSWGLLHEGESYNFAFLSIDIAGNSIIQSKYEEERIEAVYGSLYSMIERIVKVYNGKIWTWAGDGGIAAFYLGNIAQDSVNAAISIQTNMIAFNLSSNRNQFEEPVHLRIAAHQGPTAYKENKGAILSEAINYVAHLEKKGTSLDGVAVSIDIYNELTARLRKVFQSKGIFEEKETYEVSFAMPWMNW